MLLGKIKDPRAGEQLVQKLDDEEQYVRHRVAYALGEIGTTGALKALMGALNSNIGDREFEEIARAAIAKIKPPSGLTSIPYATLHGLPEDRGFSNDPYSANDPYSRPDPYLGSGGYLSGEEDYQRRLREQDEEYQRQLRAREEEEYQQRLREEEEEQQRIAEAYWALNNDDNFGLG